MLLSSEYSLLQFSLEIQLLVLCHVFFLQSASIDDLLSLININAIHFSSDQCLVVFNQCSNLTNMEIITCLCVQLMGLFLSLWKIASNLKVTKVRIWTNHLQEYCRDHSVLSLFVFNIAWDNMNWVPASFFDTLLWFNVFLDKETSSESFIVSIKKIDRCDNSLVKVKKSISLENIVELLFKSQQFIWWVNGISTCIWVVLVWPWWSVWVTVSVIFTLQEFSTSSLIELNLWLHILE